MKSLFLFAVCVMIRGSQVIEVPQERVGQMEAKGFTLAQQVTVTTTNIVPADAAAQKRYAWAWWLSQKCIAYGATSDETLDNIANMTAWVQHTDLTEAQARGIQADGSAMIAVKAELAQFGGWRACLTITGQAQTNITTETRWEPVQ